jgi:LmbE family N-acetylglucosaminyl deacetylase
VIRAMVRWAYRHFVWPDAKNSLRAALLLSAHDRSPEEITSFDESRVLVLAPHMDDEAIGCGGVLIRHVRAGAEVTVVYLTDGSLGDARLLEGTVLPSVRDARRCATARRRKRESEVYAKRTGVHRRVFLDAPDGALKPTPGLIATVSTLLCEGRPDVLYVPFVMDHHEDHWQTNRVLHESAAALPRALRDSLRLRGYEVWTPLVANRLADVTEVMDAKLEALAAYASQLEDTDYAHCVRGLNAYRCLGLAARRGYAEAFFECRVGEYAELMARLTS